LALTKLSGTSENSVLFVHQDIQPIWVFRLTLSLFKPLCKDLRILDRCMVQTSGVRNQQRRVLGLRNLGQDRLKRKRLRVLAALILKPRHYLVILLYQLCLFCILLGSSVFKHALLWLWFYCDLDRHLLDQRCETVPRLVYNTVTRKCHLSAFRVDLFKSILNPPHHFPGTFWVLFHLKLSLF
jgi:hypothetical protein